MAKYVICEFCGEKINKKDATYVQARPYCENCVNEAEIYSDAEVLDEDEEEDEDEDEDDDDYDDYVDD